MISIKPKILLFGANGQVGREVVNVFHLSCFDLVFFAKNDADITDMDALSLIFKEHQSSSFVINCAAYTNVDEAENNSDCCNNINDVAVGNLAKLCKEFDIPIIHISTDYVFDGKSLSPYCENDSTYPLGIYGKSKLMGELALSSIYHKHIILRVSWVFSSSGRNFVKTILKLSTERDSLNIVDDQFGAPTPANDIAKAILSICLKIKDSLDTRKLWGTYHYQGVPKVSWYEFAKEIIKASNDDKVKHVSLNPISTKQFPTPAKRPMNSILNTDKISKQFSIGAPEWKDSLKGVINAI